MTEILPIVRPPVPRGQRAVRHEVLGDHVPALTIVIAEIHSEEWLLEIEAIAVD